MFEVGKTYVNLRENAGETVILPFGRKLYIGKEITVLSDEGLLSGKGDIRCYKVINDRGEMGMVDDEDFPMFTETGGVKEQKGFSRMVRDFWRRLHDRFAGKGTRMEKQGDDGICRKAAFHFLMRA